MNKYRIPSARAAWHDYNGGTTGRDVACRVCNVETETPAIKNEKMQAIADHCGLLSTAMGGMKQINKSHIE